MDMRFCFCLSQTNLLAIGSPFYQFDNLGKLLPLLAPLLILQLGLMAFALLDWARRSRTRYLDRWVWLPIIVVFGLLGPIAYFLLGREEE